MPPLASYAVFEVDKLVAEKGIRPLVAGGVATLAELRPREFQEAVERGAGPLFPLIFHPQLEMGGATQTVPPGLGALATAMNASAGAYRLKFYPEA
jgi:hypothetical protein